MAKVRKPKEYKFTDPHGRPIIRLFGHTYVWIEQDNGKLKLEPTGNPWVMKTWDCCGHREIV